MPIPAALRHPPWPLVAFTWTHGAPPWVPTFTPSLRRRPQHVTSVVRSRPGLGIEPSRSSHLTDVTDSRVCTTLQGPPRGPPSSLPSTLPALTVTPRSWTRQTSWASLSPPWGTRRAICTSSRSLLSPPPPRAPPAVSSAARPRLSRPGPEQAQAAGGAPGPFPRGAECQAAALWHQGQDWALLPAAHRLPHPWEAPGEAGQGKGAQAGGAEEFPTPSCVSALPAPAVKAGGRGRGCYSATCP